MSERNKSNRDPAKRPDYAARIIDLDTDDPVDTVDSAADEVEEMVAREQRRDGKYRSGGDNTSAGIDADLDSNAPKKDDAG